MSLKKIQILRKKIIELNLDGYLIPKNDEFFNEYLPFYNDRLNFISNFTGSYGFSIILKNKNFLFVDGRYTLQATKQSGSFFKIVTIPNLMPSEVLKRKKYLDDFITNEHYLALKDLDIIKKSDLIGFHGQTIYHNSKQQISIQLGDPKKLSILLNKNVIFDFR